MTAALRGRHLSVQCRIRARACLAERSRNRASARRAAIALRVNPDVDAKTHAKISTGKAENKFGIPWSRALQAYSARPRRCPGIAIKGVDVHIGSQITELAPFRAAFAARQASSSSDCARKAIRSSASISAAGSAFPITTAAKYRRCHSDYAADGREVIAPLDARLIFEPGRMIVGNAGILVSRVLYVKEGEARTFLIIDAAMNDLIRPALYDAYHAIVPVKASPPGVPKRRYDVVGPVCETADTFATERELAELAPGDLVAILSAGAYGAVQASTYNTRPLVPEVLVKGGNGRSCASGRR